MVRKGTVFVDAGCIWIGDPCYIMGDDATDRVRDWSEFCSKINHEIPVQAPLGDGTGMLIDSGYGDGCYPVDVEYNHDGRVAKVTVTFIEDCEDDDDV